MIDTRDADGRQLIRIMNDVRKLEKQPLNEATYLRLTKLRVEAMLVVERMDAQDEAYGRKAKAQRIERKRGYPRAVRG